MAEAKQAEAEYFALQEEEAVLLRRLRDIQLTKQGDQQLFSRTQVQQDTYGDGDYYSRTYDPLASLRRQVREEVTRREALGRRRAQEAAALKQIEHLHGGLLSLRTPSRQGVRCPGVSTFKNKVSPSRLF